MKQFEDSVSLLLKRQRLSFVKSLALLLYYALAVRLPDTPLPGCVASNWLRTVLARRIFLSSGKNVSVHAGVTFGTGVAIQLGDNSSLNRGCWLSNDTIIGDDVPGSLLYADWSPCADQIVIAGAPSAVEDEYNIEVIKVGETVSNCVVEGILGERSADLISKIIYSFLLDDDRICMLAIIVQKKQREIVKINNKYKKVEFL